jgi:hypothetical protein
MRLLADQGGVPLDRVDLRGDAGEDGGVIA